MTQKGLIIRLMSTLPTMTLKNLKNIGKKQKLSILKKGLGKKQSLVSCFHYKKTQKGSLIRF